MSDLPATGTAPKALTTGDFRPDHLADPSIADVDRVYALVPIKASVDSIARRVDPAKGELYVALTTGVEVQIEKMKLNFLIEARRTGTTSAQLDAIVEVLGSREMALYLRIMGRAQAASSADALRGLLGLEPA